MSRPLKVIGKPTRKLDAHAKVTGKAVYGHDLQLPNMLHGAILRADHPSAEILSINTEKARSLSGVRAVITAADVDTNPLSYKKDHPVLKQGEVNCIRDEIAAVAADTPDIAREALRLIKVAYREREGIFDPDRALAQQAPRLNRLASGNFPNKNIAETFNYEHGDLEAQKAASSVIVTRTYNLQRVTHCCLATSNVTADWSVAEQRLTIYSSTQVPYLYQRDLGFVLKLDPSRIRVVQPVIGGGFGSKLDLHPFEPICALLSMKTGRPVQILFTRKEEFEVSVTRQPIRIELTTGADSNGRFTFREVKEIMDNGAYTSWGATTPFVSMQTFSSLYRLPACRFEATSVYTNNVYAGSFRGYGNPQATFALERNIDLMAVELGMDPAEMRLLNANQEGETTGQGMYFASCGHEQALRLVLEKSEYFAKRNNPGSGRFRRGIGLASMLHVGGGAKIYPSDGCGTTVRLDDFGYLNIITGANEIGQGSETVLAMIAAEELGLPLPKIKIINSDTDIKPWDVGVHASRTSFIAGNSLLGALANLKARLTPVAARLLEEEEADLVYRDGRITVHDRQKSVGLDKVVRTIHFKEPYELCIESHYYEPPSKFQGKDFKGDVSAAYAFAAQAVEVEVDSLTGNVRVLAVHVAQDVGRVLNPLGLQGQIEGGVVMGLGYALYEELHMDRGRHLNPNFHDYKLPTAADVPPIFFYPIETMDREGPYGAKGVSEAPLIPTAPAVANALANALGVQLTSLPMTPEKILRALNGEELSP